MIRRERRDAVANGIEIFPLTGKDITEEHWDAFFQFYLDTGARKWGKARSSSSLDRTCRGSKRLRMREVTG